MENLFLAVIAVNALLGAAIVGGLAFGMRLLNRKLDQIEAELQQEVLPRVKDFARVSEKVAAAAADARRRASRVDVTVAARTQQVRRLLGRAASTAEDAAGVAGHLKEAAEPPDSSGPEPGDEGE